MNMLQVSDFLYVRTPSKRLKWADVRCDDYWSVPPDLSWLGSITVARAISYVAQFGVGQCCGGDHLVKCLDDTNVCLNPLHFRPQAIPPDPHTDYMSRHYSPIENLWPAAVFCKDKNWWFLNKLGVHTWNGVACDVSWLCGGGDGCTPGSVQTLRAHLLAPYGKACCGETHLMRCAPTTTTSTTTITFTTTTTETFTTSRASDNMCKQTVQFQPHILLTDKYNRPSGMDNCTAVSDHLLGMLAEVPKHWQAASCNDDW